MSRKSCKTCAHFACEVVLGDGRPLEQRGLCAVHRNAQRAGRPAAAAPSPPRRALGMVKVYNSPSIYDEMKERAMKGEQE